MHQYQNIFVMDMILRKESILYPQGTVHVVPMITLLRNVLLLRTFGHFNEFVTI